MNQIHLIVEIEYNNAEVSTAPLFELYTKLIQNFHNAVTYATSI